MTAVAIVIAGLEVGVDAQGRYSLNDLHRAAGGEDRHKPGNWQQNQQTKALIAEIEIAGIPAIQSKQGLGTFACRELVYAFAMWISPSFHLKVIRAYDAGATGRTQSVAALPDFTDPVVAARAWADEREGRQAAQLQLEAAGPKVVFADAILNADGTTTVADVARTIGAPVQKMRKALKIKKVILANDAPAALYVSKGYFKEETFSYPTKTRGTQIGHSARVTGKGIEFLRRFAIRHADLLGLLPNGGAQNASLFDAVGKQA